MIPPGCTLSGAAFNSAFSSAFASGSLVCGPYEAVTADLYTKGIQAADTFQPIQETEIEQ